jgi:hypothetical protein
MGAYALEVAKRIDRRQCVAQIAGECLGAETAYRAAASTHGVAKFAPLACAARLLVAELEALERALANPLTR